MYNSYFNLNENPFSIAPDPRFLYMSEQHREALAHLMFALETEGGFVLLTGEVGTGKTTVCRCLLEQLPGDLNVAFVLNPRLTASELLATVCDELQIDYPAGTTSGKILVDKINRYLLATHAAGRKTVLIIDEAQNLSAEVLEQIRLLTNLETTQRKLLQVVMLGQPELRELLARPELRQLSQRITARYHLGPLERGEVAAYINHRLAVAGHRKKLFNDKVISLVYRYTGGIPRLINVLCDRALLGTYVQGQDKVTTATLKTAAREVLGTDIAPCQSKPGRNLRISLALLFAALVGGWLSTGWHYLNGRLAPTDPAAPVQTDRSTIVAATAGTADTTDTGAVDTSPLTWPETPDPAASRESAFVRLLTLWGINYVKGTEACPQAEAQGLACLHRKGNLGSLLRLNRPAVLTMLNLKGEEFSVALTGIDHGVASLTVDNREVQIPIERLEKNWTGAYIVLWRPPPGFSQVIRPNRHGEARDWLAARIADLRGQNPVEAEATETGLAEAVEKYQKAEGIRADGMAGPETIIHLNTSTGQPVILLTRN